MTFQRVYFHCSKCDSIVFWNYKEIHEIECHQLTEVTFSHPYINTKGSRMAVQVLKIVNEPKISSGNFLSATEATNKNIITNSYCELDCANIIETPFVEYCIYLNQDDMALGNLTPFSLIILSSGNIEELFLAIPHEITPPSTILICDSSLRKFPNFEEILLMSVKKLALTGIAKIVSLTLKSGSSETDPELVKKYVRNYGLRVPYLLTLRKDYCISRFCNFMVTDIIEKSVRFYNLSQSMLQCSTFNSQSNSIDECRHSQLEASQNCSIDALAVVVGNISLNHSANCSAPDKVFATSTPNRDNYKTKKKRKKCKNSLILSADISSVAMESSSTPKYFKFEDDTTFNIVNERSQYYILKISSGSYYYRDEIYYSVTNLISKKCNHDLNSKFSLCNLWTGILLSGYSGTGKTSLVKELSTELKLPLIVVSILEWTKSKLTESDYILMSYRLAKDKAPSILFFDDVDSLCIKGRKQSVGFTSLLVKIISDIKKLEYPIILISATNRPEEIPSKLLECGKFDKEIVLKLPDCEKKSNILWHFISQFPVSITREDVNEIVKLAKGFSTADLKSLVNTAFHISSQKWKIGGTKLGNPLLTLGDLKESVLSVVPSFLRRNYTAVNEVYWSDIFGYDAVKKQIQDMLKYQDGCYAMRGLLLFGPPGCSKTMIVKAIATETKFTYIPVKCSDLLSKYIGETERALCSLFRRASMSAPSLIFIDEIDSLCGERIGQGCMEASVVTELLSLIRKACNGGDILIIGATNRPQAVDEALLSPGCLELLLYIDLPDCASRCSIWSGLLEGIPSKNIDIKCLCSKTAGFSGAEISDAYEKTAQSLLTKFVEGNNLNIEEIYFTHHDFLIALENILPRTSTAVLQNNREFYLARKDYSLNKYLG